MTITVIFWKSAPSIKPIQRKRKSEDFKSIRVCNSEDTESLHVLYKNPS